MSAAMLTAMWINELCGRIAGARDLGNVTSYLTRQPDGWTLHCDLLKSRAAKWEIPFNSQLETILRGVR